MVAPGSGPARYRSRMQGFESGLVDIVREFLRSDHLLRRAFGRYRSGDLSWEEVQQIAGDDDSSALFRLKERCHALFRAGELDRNTARMGLFDLAVGSLFHEAMKLRENYYQLEVYAPKVAQARQAAGADAGPLFEEFDRILVTSRARLAEAVEESEALLYQTRQQFRSLVSVHKDSGLVARFLLENASRAEEVLGEPLDAFFAWMHGAPATGYALAARSYLSSGFFDEAGRALAQALARDPQRKEWKRAAAYAAGMSSYLRGRYSDALRQLDEWVEAQPEPDEAQLARLAHSAISHLGQLGEGEDGVSLAAEAERLAERLSPLAAAS